MTLRWRKLGLIFSPADGPEWMCSHASLPVALPLDGDRFRIYFAARDAEQRSHVGFIETDVTNPGRILDVSPRPVLAPGPLGYFDDHGVYASCLVADGADLLLYYSGWSPGPRRPLFYASIGLAVSRDGGLSFEKTSVAPMLGRNEIDPWMVAAPFVERAEDRWRMWYLSGLHWTLHGSALHSHYHVKYAESRDGRRWNRNGDVAIELRDGEEHISRPFVLRGRQGYLAWYGYNDGSGYRIGYAESPDGKQFTRRDEAVGIERSAEGWDAEAMSYPWILEHDGARFMLYNGNRFGIDGIGLAVAEDPTP